MPLDSLLGDGWLEYVHPDDRAAAIDNWMRSVATGAPLENQYRLRRADGIYRWLYVPGQLRRTSDAMPDVAHKVLIQQLRQLERDGLVSRTVVSEPHVQVEHCLTAFGTSLGPVLNEMAAWAKRHHRRFGATLSATK